MYSNSRCHKVEKKFVLYFVRMNNSCTFAVANEAYPFVGHG